MREQLAGRHDADDVLLVLPGDQVARHRELGDLDPSPHHPRKLVLLHAHLARGTERVVEIWADRRGGRAGGLERVAARAEVDEGLLARLRVALRTASAPGDGEGPRGEGERGRDAAPADHRAAAHMR